MTLVPDGKIFRINGAFFGDKKGDVTLGDRWGETGKAEVVDWAMGSIRFEVLGELSEACILTVSNAVGEDKLTHPGCNGPEPGRPFVTT